jgi:TonB family protein
MASLGVEPTLWSNYISNLRLHPEVTYHAIMSFRSLLFCPDEKTARVVTQVLSELDFTVETAHESFAAVQRLTEEHFHALVVDCQNEQDASLLFKAARSSAQNNSSLSVAVVEGQAGVAKAFRIGANLVLTKPVNVEQSKSTLRVARGLLKKTQPKPAAATIASATEPTVASKQTDTFVPKPAVEPASRKKEDSGQRQIFASAPKLPSPALVPPPSPAASVPYSGLVVESEPEPLPEAADAALLESLPELSRTHSAHNASPALLRRAEPIAASTSGHAAAAALAPETKTVDFRPTGAAPMVTNDPIVPLAEIAELPKSEPVNAPTFSSLENSTRNTGGGRFLKVAVVVAVLVGVGYFASRTAQVQKFLHRSSATQASSQGTPDLGPTSDVQPEAVRSTSRSTNTPPNEAATPAPSATGGSHASEAASAHTAQQPAANSGAAETIEVQELPIARETSKVTVTPKPQAIVVKNDETSEKPLAQPTAPPVNVVSETKAPQLPDLTPRNIELPKPSPGTVRISQGVSQGLVLKKISPVYPAMARQFHKEGAVQLLATIDKYGEVKKIHVLSGDGMLVKAATDAVEQWEYRPYLLNGQPVEIETQITVVFKAQN